MLEQVITGTAYSSARRMIFRASSKEHASGLPMNTGFPNGASSRNCCRCRLPSLLVSKNASISAISAIRSTISVPHCRMIRVNLSTLVQLSLKLSLPPGNALTILPTPGM